MTPRTLASGCAGETTVTNGTSNNGSDCKSSGTVGSEPVMPIRHVPLSIGCTKQAHTELSFKIRQRLADHGLRPAKLAPGRRKTALRSRRDEGTQLIQGDRL